MDREIFVIDGRRCVKRGDNFIKLCVGDNDTCIRLRMGGNNLCTGHTNGTVRTPNEGLNKGDKMVLNGIRYKYNGMQKVRLCNGIENGVKCEQASVNGGLCKTHSPQWHCQFTGAKCTKIRTRGKYCVQHINNIDNAPTMTKESFIKSATEIHRGYYLYDKIDFKNATDHIGIECPKHGIFLQRPCEHLRPRGCPKCKKSKGEEKIRGHLERINIIYDFQRKFESCRVTKPLPFDFWLPELNLVIEYDGDQHFKEVTMWGDTDGLAKRILHDKIKDKWCIDNGKILLRISFKDLDNIPDIIDNAVFHAKEGPVTPDANGKMTGYILATRYYAQIGRVYPEYDYVHHVD